MTVLRIIFPALSLFIEFSKPQKCARHFSCLMFAVKKSGCEFLPRKKAVRWRWSIWPCSAHNSPSLKVGRGIIPKSPSPYSISGVLASPGTTQHLHHSYIDSYNTPGKERRGKILVLSTWGWKDFIGNRLLKQGIKLVSSEAPHAAHHAIPERLCPDQPSVRS